MLGSWSLVRAILRSVPFVSLWYRIKIIRNVLMSRIVKMRILLICRIMRRGLVYRIIILFSLMLMLVIRILIPTIPTKRSKVGVTRVGLRVTVICVR